MYEANYEALANAIILQAVVQEAEKPSERQTGT